MKEELKIRLREKIEQSEVRFDEEKAMLRVQQTKWAGGYHTRKTGILHPVRDAAEYAEAIYHAERTDLYPRAERILNKICSLQDQRADSKTFGLWSYYLEENLDGMLAPDYNWADFISKCLLGVVIQFGNCLSETTRRMLHQSIRCAAECSIRRNVAPDYTNISLMSGMTILSAGELLADNRLCEIGMARLKRLYDYTVFNGAFSEYNSSAYILVALFEIKRMLCFFQNPQARVWAEAFNGYAWDLLSLHYNSGIHQLTPPQARAYRDLDNGSLAFIIWLGTDGQYGYLPEDEQGISLESLLYPPQCPKHLWPQFEPQTRYLADKYYRRNNLRHAGEDTTIIRDLDHPDLTAYSYQTPIYSLGVFQACDCWNQRRNAMVLWGDKSPSYLRLRGMIGDYDFCSGMVIAAQYQNTILGHLGLVTDRGSFHYILDEHKDGRYQTDCLYFQFELGGEREDLTITARPDGYYIEDEDITIRITIHSFIWNGKPGGIRLSEDCRKLLLIGYEGPTIWIDTNCFAETYGVFTMSVWSKTEEAPKLAIQETKVSDGMVNSRLLVGEHTLRAASMVSPVTFRKASEYAAVGTGVTSDKKQGGSYAEKPNTGNGAEDSV